MPYFVTDKADGCSGWATIKADGEVIGCHKTKVQAVAQMVAVSLAEKMQPGGERVDSGPQAVIVDIDGTLIQGGKRVEKVYNFLDDMNDTQIFIVTGRNASNRESTTNQLNDLSIDFDRLFMNPGSTASTAEFKKATGEKLLKEYNVILAIDNNPTMRKVYRDLGITALDVPDVPKVKSDENDPDEEDKNVPDEERVVNISVPAYMRAAARRGLELNRQGFGGDGLTDKTKQEARDMAEGRISEDKWRRISPWIARHLVDLDAPKNSNPDDKDYPGAGLVAHLLWGSGPTRGRALAAMNYAENVVEKLDEERHLAGGHDQLTHGSGGGAGSKARDLVADGTITQGNSLDKSLEEKIVLYDSEKRFGQGITTEDEALDRIAKMQGFDGTPQRSTDWDEFNRIKPPEVVGTNGEKIMATSEYRLSRGFTEGKLPNGSTISAQDAKKSFTDGEYFAGMGVYGNGIYSTTDLSLAMKYTKNNDMTDISQFKFATDSRVGSFTKLTKEMYDKQNIDDSLPLSLTNVGRYAAARGYDAIKIDVEGSSQFLVLNRGKVILSPDYSSGDVVEP